MSTAARSSTSPERATRRGEVSASMPSIGRIRSMGSGAGISGREDAVPNAVTRGEGRGGARTGIPSTRTAPGVAGTSTAITTTTVTGTSTTTRATSPGESAH